MSNRIFDRVWALEKQVAHLFASMSVGATGAVGTVTGLGVSGVVRNSAGNYTITFEDAYPKFLHASFGFVGSAKSGIGSVEVNMAPTTLQDTIKANKQVVIQCYSNASSIAATGTLNLTTDIVLTKKAPGDFANGHTVNTQVAAAAANPTNTVLVAFTGSEAATVITVTPNDGTNNAATPVNLTTAELVQLINTGAVTGKTVTITDTSGLRSKITATGGDATVMADAGEGDNVTATFAGGSDDAVGTAADPANGSLLTMAFAFRRTSVGPA